MPSTFLLVFLVYSSTKNAFALQSHEDRQARLRPSVMCNRKINAMQSFRGSDILHLCLQRFQRMCVNIFGDGDGLSLEDILMKDSGSTQYILASKHVRRYWLVYTNRWNPMDFVLNFLSIFSSQSANQQDIITQVSTREFWHQITGNDPT